MAEVIAYYDCGAGGLVSIRFSNADAVLTFLNRQDHASLPHALRQQLAADGFAYAGEGFALRGVGNHIALSGPLGAEFERCPVIRPPQ